MAATARQTRALAALVLSGLLLVAGAACSSTDAPSTAAPQAGGTTSSPATTPDGTAGGTDPAMELRPVLAIVTDDGTVPSPAGGTELSDADGVAYVVGPSAGSGLVASASAQPDQSGSWVVRVGLTTAGEAAMNRLAGACSARTIECPTGRLAIVVDDRVVSAPAMSAAQFTGDITISGSFDRAGATQIAEALSQASQP